MTQFYIGTAGWSYLRWDKEFYPAGMKAADKLAFYATRFNAIELNNTFYHVPPPEQFVDWEHQVPASFRFAVKASHFITHTKRLKDAGETLPSFLDALQLQQKAGPILFQLPSTFKVDLPRLRAFLTQLPKGRRYVIELINPSWHTDEVFDLLAQHKVAFCLFDMEERQSPRRLTTDFSYVRLLGRSGYQVENFLREWRIWLLNETGMAYVIFHNRENKSLGFTNATALQEMTKEKAA
jgi:uncharacterized protein YecE (DUF72 family)